MKNVEFENELVALQSNMRNFAFSLTLNRDDAEDLLQDTTLKVLDNQEKFTDNVNFKGWVLTIMKNIFINNYRKIVRNQTVVDKTEDEVLTLMDDALVNGCSILTIGQYMQPSRKNMMVSEYITPEKFTEYRNIGLEKGFRIVESAPLVRSSYCAENHIPKFNAE